MPPLNPTDQNDLSEKDCDNCELTAVAELAQSLILELKSFGSNHENLKSQFQAVAHDVDRLSSIIRDGNGKPSILTAVALLEHDINVLKKDMEKIEATVADNIEHLRQDVHDYRGIKIAVDEIIKWKDELSKNDVEHTRGRWQLRVAVLGGTIAVLTAMANIIVQIINAKH